MLMIRLWKDLPEFIKREVKKSFKMNLFIPPTAVLVVYRFGDYTLFDSTNGLKICQGELPRSIINTIFGSDDSVND